MGLSQLAEMCQKCPKVNTCDHKRMEALAVLPEPCERQFAKGVTISGYAQFVPLDVDVGETIVQINTAQQTKDFAEAVLKELERTLCVPADLLRGRYGRR